MTSPAQPSQTRFGPSTLVIELNTLMAHITAGADSSVLNVLSEPMNSRFRLTEGQQSELSVLERDRQAIARLKALVERGAASAGRSRFVVAFGPDTSARGFRHELRMETSAAAPTRAQSAADTPITTSAIAHCDADCRNWGWG
ncbi:MAG TPA: hypothetical protein VIT65_25970 [Microlunatus sp.]